MNVLINSTNNTIFIINNKYLALTYIILTQNLNLVNIKFNSDDAFIFKDDTNRCEFDFKLMSLLWYDQYLV